MKKYLTESPQATTNDGEVVEDSFDAKIDSYLQNFEAESPSKDGMTTESRITLKLLMRQLFEAAEEEEPEEAEAAEATTHLDDPDAGEPPIEQAPLDAPSDEGDVASKGEAPKPMKTLDIQNFASHVARLVKNFPNLVDPTTIILNRTRNYIAKNYGDEIALQLDNTLSQKFGISNKGQFDDIPEAPPAKGAGPTGA